MPEEEQRDPLTPSSALEEILAEIIRLEESRDVLRVEQDTIDKRLSHLKDVAAVEMAEAFQFGTPSVVYGGRKFSAPLETAVTVPAEHKKKVVAIGAAMGMDLLQVSQPKIQSYIRKRGGDGDNQAGDDLDKGTPFEGLVKLFTRPVLRVTKA